jgi:ABC-type transport system involved in multi-copper enzyme maturation, permease component
MKRFLVLLGREISHYFHQPLAYIVLFFFLLLTAANFHAALASLNREPSQTSVVEAFFNSVLFWFPFVLIFPLLTMRLFSEEYKLGTIETLMTAPVRDGQVVAAKFLGSFVFYVVLWAPSALYFLIFRWLTGQNAADSPGSYLGAYAMLILVGMFYLSIGCLASALTKNQIVAATISFALISLMFFLSLLSFIFLKASSGCVKLPTIFRLSSTWASFRGAFSTRVPSFFTLA